MQFTYQKCVFIGDKGFKSLTNCFCKFPCSQLAKQNLPVKEADSQGTCSPLVFLEQLEYKAKLCFEFHENTGEQLMPMNIAHLKDSGMIRIKMNG